MKINIVGAGEEGKKSHYGGIEVAPKRLAQTLRELGHEVDYNGKRKLSYYDIIDIHFGFNLRFLNRAKKEAAVVVHVHSIPEDMVGGIIGFRIISPIVSWYLKKFYQSAPFLIPVSKFCNDKVKERGILTPSEPISNGVPLNKFHPALPSDKIKARKALCQKYNLDTDKPIIGGIGSLMPRKGVKDFKRLAQKFPEYQFLWVGKTQPVYPRFMFNLHLGKVPKNMILTGFIEDIHHFYHGIDLLLVPTFVETQGIPPIEGAATKTPLLIRNIPVFDWLEDRENCYKANDLQGFVELLPQAVNAYPEAYLLSALEDVKQHDITLTTQEHLKIYQQVINNFKEHQTA